LPYCVEESEESLRLLKEHQRALMKRKLAIGGNHG
jgi:hypothetical protein